MVKASMRALSSNWLTSRFSDPSSSFSAVLPLNSGSKSMCVVMIVTGVRNS